MQTERVQNERPQGLQNALFLLEMCGGILFEKRRNKKNLARERLLRVLDGI